MNIGPQMVIDEINLFLSITDLTLVDEPPIFFFVECLWPGISLHVHR